MSKPVHSWHVPKRRMVGGRRRGCRHHDARGAALHRARRLHLVLLAALMLPYHVLRVHSNLMLLLCEHHFVLLLVLDDVCRVLLQELVADHVVGEAVLAQAGLVFLALGVLAVL